MKNNMSEEELKAFEEIINEIAEEEAKTLGDNDNIYEILDYIYLFTTYVLDGMNDYIGFDLNEYNFNKLKGQRIYTIEERMRFTDDFYKSLNIDLQINDKLNSGVIELVGDIYADNKENEADLNDLIAHCESSKSHSNDKIVLSNTGYFFDSSRLAHELAHYMDKDGHDYHYPLHNMLIETKAITMELLFFKYYENSHKEEIDIMRKERLSDLLIAADYLIKVFRFMEMKLKLGKISRENYKTLYKSDDEYDERLLRLRRYSRRNTASTLQYFIGLCLAPTIYYTILQDSELKERIAEMFNNDSMYIYQVLHLINSPHEEVNSDMDLLAGEHFLSTIKSNIKRYIDEALQKEPSKTA